jgi:hypothetical protein
MNASVSHQVHQGGQGDTGPHHVSSESVAEAMGIGMGNVAGSSVMAEQGA